MSSPVTTVTISTRTNNAFNAAAVALPESPKRKIRSVALDVQGSVFIAKLNTDAIRQQVLGAEQLVYAALGKLIEAKQTCDENAKQLEKLQQPETIYTYYRTEEHKEYSEQLAEGINELRKVADSVFDKSTYYDTYMKANVDVEALVGGAADLTRCMDELYERTQNGTYLDSDYDSDA